MADVHMEGQEASLAGSKRYRLQRVVQASFGAPDDPDYVFDITSSQDNSVMVVSLSTNTLKLYSPMTGQFLGDCHGHTDTINDVLFPDPKTSTLFCSASSDGTIRVWDTRTRQQVRALRSCQPSEIFSLSFGGSSSDLVAAGSKAKVLVWDWRTHKELACLEECHTEDVTQVRFHPTRREKLVSASVDGLMCVFNTLGDINDDEGLDVVMGVGTSVGRIGFYGKSNERLWCLTHIESLSVWDFEEGAKVADFNDTRAKASANWTLPPVDYLVQCHYLADSESLWLIAGNSLGSLGYFPINYGESKESAGPNTGIIGPVGAVLEGGHTSVVRRVWSPWQHKDGLGPLAGLLCWTGGEDGRICSWSEGNTETGRSQAWASKSLVMRHNRQKRKSHPY